MFMSVIVYNIKHSICLTIFAITTATLLASEAYKVTSALHDGIQIIALLLSFLK